MAETTDWKEAVKESIFQLFKDSPENFVRIVFFLDEESKLFRGEEESPVWKTLKYARRSPEAFKMYALKLAEDTKQIEKDSRFKEVIREIYDQMMNATDDCEDDGKKMDPLKQDLMISSFPGMNMMWNVVGLEGRKQITSIILQAARTINTSQTVSILDDALGLISKHGNKVAVALAAVYLTATAIKSIYKWYIGEISGKRCAKDIIDSFGSLGGGAAGGLAGANIGAFAGPAGALLGGIFGSLAGSMAGGALCDRLTQSLFNIPKSVALENAYGFLGVECNATNNEINRAFRKLCLRHHPDKGGNKEDFMALQVHMQNIKFSRGEVA